MSSWLLGVNDDDKWCIEDANSCRTIVDDIEQKRDARLIASAPEMYELLENIVFYISECQKLYSPFPHELITYADIAKQLLAQIDGEEENA